MRFSPSLSLLAPGIDRLFLAILSIMHLGLAVSTFAQDDPQALPTPTIETPAPPAGTTPLRVKLPPPSTIDIDMDMFLQSPDILVEQLEDILWVFQPEPGKKLLQIPLTIKPQSTPIELSDRLLQVRGGRFIAWRIEYEGQESSSFSGRGISPIAGGPPTNRNNPANSRKTTSQQGIRALAPNQAPLTPITVGGIPVDPPHVARSLTLDPDGTLRWSLDRVFPTATLKDQDSLYLFKVRSDILAKRAPILPRAEAGSSQDTPESRADRQRQFQEKQFQYRLQAQAYQDLNQKVLNAPIKFDTPLPPRIWAIFEVNALAPDYTIEGTPTPLPWKITSTQFDAARTLVKPSDKSTPSQNTLVYLHQVKQIIQPDMHPWSLRTVAVSLAGSNLVNFSSPGDDVFQICQTIFNGKDAASHSTLVRELVSITPPNNATIQLLQQAAHHPDPFTQLSALRGLLQSGKLDDSQFALLVQTANRILADTSAPPPSDLIEDLLEAGHFLPPAADGSGANPMLSSLINNLNFQVPDPKRRDQIIATILINNAEPLASQWFSRKLLNPDDLPLLQRTLEILASAQSPNNKNALGSTVGNRAPARDPNPNHPPLDPLCPMPPSSASANLAPPIGQWTEQNNQSQLILNQPIILDLPDHNFFKTLTHSDKTISSLAWTALNHCTFPPGNNNTGPEAAPYLALVEIALQNPPVPPQIVSFLTRQFNTPAVANALVRIAANDSGPAAHLAAQSLLGCRLPLEQTLVGLTIDEYQALAQRCYQIRQQTPPYAIGLLRDRQRDTHMVQWLVQQIAFGTLPDTNAWAIHFGGETALLPQTVSPDDELALAAASGLVCLAGGTDEIAQKWFRDLRSQSNKAVEYAQTQWNKVRKSIYITRLKSAVGPYRLSFKLYPADSGLYVPKKTGPQGPDPSPLFNPPSSANSPGISGPGSSPTAIVAVSTKPEMDESLGILQLEEADQTIRFANQALALSVPDTHLALRIDRIAGLKNLGNPKVTALPLERKDTGVDLFQQPGSANTWVGRFSLIDGRIAELTLEPAKNTPTTPSVTSQPTTSQPATTQP